MTSLIRIFFQISSTQRFQIARSFDHQLLITHYLHDVSVLKYTHVLHVYIFKMLPALGAQYYDVI